MKIKEFIRTKKFQLVILDFFLKLETMLVFCYLFFLFLNVLSKGELVEFFNINNLLFSSVLVAFVCYFLGKKIFEKESDEKGKEEEEGVFFKRSNFFWKTSILVFLILMFFLGVIFLFLVGKENWISMNIISLIWMILGLILLLKFNNFNDLDN